MNKYNHPAQTFIKFCAHDWEIRKQVMVKNCFTTASGVEFDLIDNDGTVYHGKLEPKANEITVGELTIDNLLNYWGYKEN